MKNMIRDNAAHTLGVTFSTLILRAVGLSSLVLFMLAGFALSTRFMS